MRDSAEKPISKGNPYGSLDLRHLSAFQQVYLTRDYTTAGHDLNTNRKGVVRMIERLEDTFQSRLFTPENRTTLQPSPFADRLYNDLRFLNTAREALHEQVAEIRASGRLLRVGSSPSVFRTEIFRTIFRTLQTSDRLRTSYVPVKSGDAAKALAAGICDLHVGGLSRGSARFSDEKIGEIRFQILERKGGANAGVPPSPYKVSLDGCVPESTEPLADYRPLDEIRFLHWLDHPEDCPAGTRILAPHIPRDPVHWIPEESLLEVRQPIHIQFLRQHPYEFLPSLVKGLKSRMSAK